MDGKCPICSLPSERGVAGDAEQVRCPRCGPFIITRTARVMLGSRLDSSATALARLSYAVRHHTSEEDWFCVDSANLGELVTTRLPTVEVQRLNLLRWMAELVDDDRFGTVRPPHADHLAAVVGVTNGARVQDLMQHALSERFIEYTEDGGYRIGSKGWNQLEKQQAPTPPAPVIPPASSGAPQIIQATCPACGPRRRAEVMATHSERQPPDDDIYEVTTLEILRCCGCSALYVKRDAAFSEDIEHEQDPVTGEWFAVPQSKTTYWPPREQRARPHWFESLADEISRRLLDEIYAAMSQGMLTLAAMGVRALLDRLFDIAGADPAANFGDKLNDLAAQGMIGAMEREQLQIMTDAGSAAAHRGWRPDIEQLSTTLDAAEAMLHRVSVMPEKAAALRASVPPRPQRKKKPR